MSIITSFGLGFVIFLIKTGQCTTEVGLVSTEFQPNWILLLVIFIVSTLIAAIIGVVALLKIPVVPELPEFQEPDANWMKTYTTFENGLWQQEPQSSYPTANRNETYPMETLQGTSEKTQEVWGNPQPQSYEPQIMQPSFTVMTQRM